MTRKERIRKRLASYWKLELGNALIVPAFALFATRSWGSGPGFLTVLALVPVMGLLLVGGLYWRGKLHAIDGRVATLDGALRIADGLQKPFLAANVALVLALVASTAIPALASSRTDWMTGAILAALAVAEYVNYYHRQLQHFDHMADFRRLLGGKGFRRSQMAVDLAA